MSILHRTAYLTLAALLTIVPAACGGDDDDDDTADDNGDDNTPDAAVDETDAAVDDTDAAVDETDAAVIDGPQYLLGLVVDPEGPLPPASSRIIATVAVDGATADLQLQGIYAAECPDQGANGTPVGDPVVYTDVAIGKGGTFELTIEDELEPGTVPGFCTTPIAVVLMVSGRVQADGAPCGTLEGTAIAFNVTGTFGGVPIETGTVGEDLPPAENECDPAILR